MDIAIHHSAWKAWLKIQRSSSRSLRKCLNGREYDICLLERSPERRPSFAVPTHRIKMAMSSLGCPSEELVPLRLISNSHGRFLRKKNSWSKHFMTGSSHLVGRPLLVLLTKTWRASGRIKVYGITSGKRIPQLRGCTRKPCICSKTKLRTAIRHWLNSTWLQKISLKRSSTITIVQQRIVHCVTGLLS